MSTTGTPERFAAQMAEGDIFASAHFERLSADDEASALDQAVKIINRKHARTPQRAEDLHVFPAVMSTDALDSHFSRMDASSLKNYAADARAGQPFMNSHRTGSFLGGAELPLGHTYEGAYDDPLALGVDALGSGDGGSAAARSNRSTSDTAATGKAARAGIYMIKELKPNGDGSLGTDDMKRAIDSGTVRDGSVGFYGGKSICDICGNNVMDYENCPHVPGTARETQNGKIATYTVKGAHLREFSAVYAGSTPGAMFSRSALDKTERAIVDKLIGAGEVTYLEEHYRLALTDSRTHYSILGKDHSIPGFPGNDDTTRDTTRTENGRKETEMNAKKLLDAVIVRAGAKLPEEVRKGLETARAAMADDSTDTEPVLAALERTLTLSAADADLLSQFRAAGVSTVEEARKLKTDGEDGRAYRKDLIDEALRLGVAAQGDTFDKGVYQGILSEPGRSIADIKKMRDDWQKQVQARLGNVDANGKPTGTGGRQTTPLHGFEEMSQSAPPKRPAGSARSYQTRK